MWQRLVANWRLLLVLAFGILVASTLMAISPVYTRVMNDLGLQESLEDQIGGASRNGAILLGQELGEPDNARREQELAQMMSREIGWFTDYEVRYGALPLHLLAREGQSYRPGRDSPLIAVRSMSGLEERVNIVVGRAPEPTSEPGKMEVLLPVESAKYFKLQPGDTVQLGAMFDDCNRPEPTMDPDQARELALFRCTPQTFVDMRATFHIVGLIERKDPQDRYWTSGTILFSPPFATEEQGPVAYVALPEQTFFRALPAALPGFSHEFRLTGFADITRLDSSNIDDAQAALERMRARVTEAGGLADLAMEAPLNEFQNRASFNQVTLLLLLIQVLGIAVYFVMLVSSLLAERRSEEIAMLRSRGATVGQLVAMSTAEAFALGLVAAFVAPFVASAAVAALGKTGTFESISEGGFLPFTIVPASFAFALGGALIAAIATVIPAFLAARRGMVLFLRSSARPEKPILQRYYLDLGLVGLSALALWQLNQKGSVFDANSVGGWSADPLLLLSPLLLILAIGAMMFRFLPMILGLVARVVARTAGPGVTLGLWQLTRSPARYTQLALLVVMAAAVGTFAATYGETTDRSQEERALYAVGSDARLTGLGNLGSDFSDEVTEKLEGVEGVESAVTAMRGSYSIGPLPSFGARVDVLGINPARSEDLLWFREDFADQDLRTLLARISGSPLPEHGIKLQGEPTGIAIWANPLEPKLATTLWARTLDAKGIYRFHEFGTLDFTGYRRLVAPINPAHDGTVYPVSIVGLIMTSAETINDPARNLFLDDLMSIDANGIATVVDDFESSWRWDVIRTATRNRDAAQQVGQETHSGVGAIHYQSLTGAGTAIRGLHVTDPDIPIPAIASRAFMEATGLRVGGEVELVLGKLLMPFSIQGVVDYFPTMYNGEVGYLIVNQEHLYHFAGMSGENVKVAPTEAWVAFTQESEQRKAAQAALLDEFGIPAGQIIDRELVLEEIRTDPVARAGGSGILLVALVAAFAILALGFGLTLYLGGQARTVEVSVMRAVGISSRQLFTMISLEYLLIAALGLLIGTVAGLRISETMLSFLNVTDSGDRIVPSYALVTRWDTVAIAFAAVGVSFVAGVIGLAGYFLRLPVSRVLRLTR
jgi:hypothetical protein